MKLQAIGFDVDVSVATNRVRANVDKIRSRALATLERRLPVQARRDIQQEYNLKASRISAGLSDRRVDNGVVLRGSARAINLIEFGAKWNRGSGVTARVLKSGKTSMHPHAFIARGINGVKLVFERDPKRPGKRIVQGGFNDGLKKQPLISSFGTPSIGQMLKKGDRPQRLADYASGVVAAELARLTR